MPTPRVIIDVNSTDEDGETVVLLSEVAGGKLEKGRIVVAYEPEAEIAAPARVASVREDLGIAFLQVNWQALKRENPTSATLRLSRLNPSLTRAVAVPTSDQRRGRGAGSSIRISSRMSA